MTVARRTDIELTDNALAVLERRYLKKDAMGHPIENPEALFARVAENIALAEANHGASEAEVAEWAQAFYDVMANLQFMPNSPTLMNAGREFQQLSACFVLPINDSMDSIFNAVKQTALIHKSGGGTGFAFSRLRPKDDIVSSTMGVSSGPVSFMNVFDAATEAIKQGGTRRGANMAILRIDHPDIIDFIEAKQDKSRLTNFNISVGITEDFMKAVEAGEDYDLINPRSGEVSGTLNATEVFERMVQLAWEGGDPGIVFLDRINADNPTPAAGEIESTNPCGEQPLLPYESCNLGSINISKLVQGPIGKGTIDWDMFGEIVDVAVRFLDNVIDMNNFPLPQISDMTRANRKIGLGIMGFTDSLIKMGIPYNSQQAVDTIEQIMHFIRERGRDYSEKLARERGCFPNWEDSVFGPAHENRKQRNATITTIAPTGTISIICGTSSGIEPLFAVAFCRNVMDGTKLNEVNPLFEQIARERGFYSDELIEKTVDNGTVCAIDEVPDDIKQLFVTAHEVSPEWHIRIQSAAQHFTDNAVSKTVNFEKTATSEDVAHVYRLAYQLGCKGVTMYRDGSRDEQVLTTKKSYESAAPQAAAAPLEPQPRPEAIYGVTRSIPTGCGKLYITVNSDKNGKPFEVFGNMGKAGGCASSQTEALARLISLALRSGLPAELVTKQLKGISCHMPAWERGGGRVLSCADAFAKGLERALQDNGQQLKMEFGDEHLKHLGACPECGGNLSYEGGCVQCHSCGYSQCD